MKHKNYYTIFKFITPLLLISTIVIFNITEGNWQALSLLPLILIIVIKTIIINIKEKEKKKHFLDIRQYYKYPKK